jgi:hypothetical protein
MKRTDVMRTVGRMLMLGLIVVNTAGCFWLVVGAAAGAGGVIWATGKLKQELNVSVDTAHKAALKALKDLELPVIVDKKDQLTVKMESEFSDGARVWIDIDSITVKSCKIEVRVGTMGDERRSREILQTIQRYL